MASLPDSQLTRRLLLVLATVAVAAALGAALVLGASAGQVMLALLPAAVIAIPVAYLLARSLARDAAPLVQAMQEIAAGRFVELPPGSRGCYLADAPAVLNEMSRSLALRIEHLERSRLDLQQNTELLETVLGTMVEGVLVVDRDERLLFANEAARRMLEFPQREPAGRPIYELTRSPALHEAIEAAIHAGPCQRELQLQRVGRVLSFSAARLPGDALLGVVIVLHDVTELRRLERMRSEFASNVSHELKTPLTSIQAYADTLLDGAVDEPETARQFLQRIVEQAERLRTLILDLLNLSKIESQQEAFEILPVTVADVVQTCLDSHLGVAEGKGIQLSLADVDPALVVRADADGLRTILDNLLNNAINYTPAGGRVSIGWRADGKWGRIDVADTGVGIPREHQQRIFERFYRVDKARARLVGGTGLGLAIVKHLTQVFDGRIEVDAAPGKGSTFSVYLPAVH